MRHSYQKGDRVFAVESADENSVRLYGFGVYEGDEVPPKEIDAGRILHDWPNPKILLDSGEVVWGCECWWGAESEFEKRMRGSRTVISVSISNARTERARARS